MMRVVLFLSIILFYSWSIAQDTLTLQTCLELVKKNKFLYTSENAKRKKDELNCELLKWSLLPSLNSSNNFTTTFGRRVDPFTNTFTTNSANSQSFGLNSSMTIFNGFSYFYKKNKLTLEFQKATITLQQKENEVLINVIGSFLEVCKLQELIKINKTTIENQKQLKNLQRALLLAGKISLIDTLRNHNSYITEIQKQLSLNQQLNMQRIEINYLTQSTLDKQFYCAIESISKIKDKPILALHFEAQKLKLEQEVVAEQLKLERTAILPSLSIYGAVGTGFSTNNKDYSTINTPTIPFTNQINNNLYESISLNLTIPLFNKLEYVKTKRLSLITTEELVLKEKGISIELEKNKVQQLNDQLTINAQIEITENLIKNLKTIYDKMLLIYAEGKISYFELVTSINELTSKEIELINFKIIKQKQQLTFNF